MKKIFLIFFIIISSTPLFAQRNRVNNFYIGVGTTFGSYIGGNFGNTFALRFRNSYSDYDQYNYYNRDRYYNDENPFSYSPVEFNIFIGKEFNEFLSFEIQSSFIFHFIGSPIRDYVNGTSGGDDYLEYYDNSYFSGIPIMAVMKTFPAGKTNIPFYLSFSAGYQYTHESMQRVREYYSYDYGYSNYRYPQYSLYDNKWLPGIGLAIGGEFRVSDFGYTDVEFKVTNFWTESNPNSPLSMNTTPNITYIGLGAKFYFKLGR